MKPQSAALSKNSKVSVPDALASKIYTIRQQRVMLDHDIAGLYGVETKVLLQGVKRNLDRFPDDFMFQLSESELENWKSHIVTSKPAMKMGLRRPPYAFTEQGVAMLSGILRSPRAVQVNIAIMRAFVEMREAMIAHKDLSVRLQVMEQKYDRKFKVIFDALRELMAPHPPSKKSPIGFIPLSEKSSNEKTRHK